MARRTDPDDESGILLRPGDYPMLKKKPPPAADPDPPSLRGPSLKDRLRRMPWKTIGPLVGVGIAGIMLGYLIHGSGEDTGPAVKKELAAQVQKTAQAQSELATTKDALTTEQETNAKLTKDKTRLEKAKDDAAKAVSDKLSAAVGKQGEVTSADGEIRLQLIDKILFRTGEAELTAQGKQVLSSVGAALNEKEIEDKQVWVQGHTDDDPIAVPKPPKPPKPPKGKTKGKPPAIVPPLVMFATNWELSAARALTVVHYLQDKVKVDPRRLAAVAFGQWRPAGKTKAKNRRIEIVLYPKHSVVPK